MDRTAPGSGLPGMAFNRGKALASAGRLAEADGAYTRAAGLAAGGDVTTFAKAVAALEEVPGGLLQQVGRAAVPLCTFSTVLSDLFSGLHLFACLA